MKRKTHGINYRTGTDVINFYLHEMGKKEHRFWINTVRFSPSIQIHTARFAFFPGCRIWCIFPSSCQKNKEEINFNKYNYTGLQTKYHISISNNFSTLCRICHRRKIPHIQFTLQYNTLFPRKALTKIDKLTKTTLTTLTCLLLITSYFPISAPSFLYILTNKCQITHRYCP